MTDLERYLAWCKKCGHFQSVALAENFRKYELSLKDREIEAIREKVENE